MRYDQREMGKRIAELRKEKGMTQEQFAERLNITVKSVHNYERGKSFCGPDILVEIAEMMETTTDWLLMGKMEEEEKMERKEKKEEDDKGLNFEERKRLREMAEELMRMAGE